MKPKKRVKRPVQSAMFKVFLKDIVSEERLLAKLGDMVEGEVFEERFGPMFSRESRRLGQGI